VNKLNFLLVLILAVFLFTRIYQLTQNPPSLYWDEASIGYNAYSIIQAGQDEWGKALPVNFRAFGEFKLPVFIYTVALFEKIFGLNDWALRLPAVLFSLGTVILTFLLGEKFTKSRLIGVLSAFVLVTLPWFFLISRVGYEANAGLMFYLLGILLFLNASKKSLFLLLSVISFIASSYSYNSFRVLVPVTLVALIVYLLNSTKINVRRPAIYIAIISVIIYIVSLVPIVRLFSNPNNINRFQTIGIFSGRISGEESLLIFTKNYFSHFSPSFLFINGDINLRSAQGGFGQIYWLQLPFILSGLYFILKSKNAVGYLILLFTLIAPIPAAITRESPHALRAISAVPFISILTAVGVKFAADIVKNKQIVYLIFTSVTSAFFVFYFYQFIIVYPVKSSPEWQYGYKRLFLDYGGKFNTFDHVIISDYLAQPYIFYLYYQKIDPKTLRNNISYNSVDKWGFSMVNNINNLVFTSIKQQNLPKGRLLIFASPQEKIDKSFSQETIKNLDGSSAFYVYEINNK